MNKYTKWMWWKRSFNTWNKCTIIVKRFRLQSSIYQRHAVYWNCLSSTLNSTQNHELDAIERTIFRLLMIILSLTIYTNFVSIFFLSQWTARTTFNNGSAPSFWRSSDGASSITNCTNSRAKFANLSASQLQSHITHMVAAALRCNYQKWKNQQNEYTNFGDAVGPDAPNVSSLAGDYVEPLFSIIPRSCFNKVSFLNIFLILFFENCITLRPCLPIVHFAIFDK